MHSARNDDTRYIEALTDDVCLTLLSSHGVGRMAFVGDDDVPVILPVNYIVDGNDIVVRTDHGETYEHVPLHWVAFEVDEFDTEAQVGWSVLVRGRARDVTDGVGDVYEVGISKTPTTWAQASVINGLRSRSSGSAVARSCIRALLDSTATVRPRLHELVRAVADQRNR